MVKNIIFDLGNVLVKVEYENFIKGVLSEGVSEIELDKALLDGSFRNAFESGEISSKEFTRQIIGRLKNKIPPDRFIFHFNSMFAEMPSMLEIMRKLRAMGGFGLYILSNTNPFHFDYFRKNFEYLNLFNDIALSFELKLLKPDIRIYKKVLELYDLNPQETLFIDDSEENCISAANAGLHTIRFTGGKALVKELGVYGISLNGYEL